MAYPRKTEMVREEQGEVLNVLTRDYALGTFINDVGVVVMSCIEKNKFRMTVAERPTQVQHTAIVHDNRLCLPHSL